MNVTVQPEDFGRNLKIWFWEDNFGGPQRFMRLLDHETWQLIDVAEYELAPTPSLILPKVVAEELARQVLGKPATMADELVETLRIERARVEKLMDHVITMDNRRL